MKLDIKIIYRYKTAFFKIAINLIAKLPLFFLVYSIRKNNLTLIKSTIVLETILLLKDYFL